MRIYNYELLKHLSYSMETLQLLSKIDEYKGKQDLYKKQSPQILETLKNVAIIQSTKSSNAIEGIIITNKRLKSIMAEQTLPMDRSEGEIAGYRNVLKLIHASSDAIPISPSIIKQLHRDLYEYVPSQGGEWKSQDNYISETLPNGEKFIRFIPVPAFQTDEHMRQGALMDLGVYCLYPLVVLFGEPKAIQAHSVRLSSGVDGEGSIMLDYGEMDAIVMYSKIANSYAPAEIQGEEGTIVIDAIHTPARVHIHYRDGRIEDVTVPQPYEPMYYEALEFMSLIERGEKESTINSHAHSLATMKVMDEARKQTGILFPADEHFA